MLTKSAVQSLIIKTSSFYIQLFNVNGPTVLFYAFLEDLQGKPPAKQNTLNRRSLKAFFRL